MDANQIVKVLPKEMSAVNNKKERAKRVLTELENKEKYAVRKLMDATFQKKKDNELKLKVAQEGLAGLILNLNERNARNELMTNKITKKRNDLFMVDIQNKEVSQNHAEITKYMMEKIQEQTDIVEKETVILKRSHECKDSSELCRSKNNHLKAEIANKQNELNYELHIYTGLGKACQEMQQNNVNELSNYKKLNVSVAEIQYRVDSLNGIIKMLSE